jgi:hypothetical protein
LRLRYGNSRRILSEVYILSGKYFHYVKHQRLMTIGISTHVLGPNVMHEPCPMTKGRVTATITSTYINPIEPQMLNLEMRAPWSMILVDLFMLGGARAAMTMKFRVRSTALAGS